MNATPPQEVLRPCSRSGCPAQAVATLSFDYATRRVWLHDLPEPPDPASYDLCSAHMDRFRPPRGWEIEDHRHPDPGFDAMTNEEMFQADVSL